MNRFTNIKIIKFLTKLGESESFRFWLQILLLILFTGFLANQVVQPVFSPRIESIEMKPLYIGSIDESDRYYQVSKITYVIASPLIPIKKTIELELPHSQYPGFGEQIQLMANYKEFSPYVTIKEFFNDLFNNFQNVQILHAEINTPIFHAKQLEVNIYVKELIDNAPERDRLEYTDYYWWTHNTLNPITDCSVRKFGPEDLGWAIYEDKYFFRFRYMVLKNICEQEFRGYILDIPTNDGIACDRYIMVVEYENNTKMTFDPGEEKTIILIDQPEEKHRKIYNHTKLFNMTSLTRSCTNFQSIVKEGLLN